ncbi:MAG: tryptophan-rich sensory protein [Clostridia bacterium]|nr:tryptophan-rich sensory protein [Clostridia bacterium]
MKKHNLLSLLFYVVSAEAIGGLSALLTGNFSDFFDKYLEPPLLPPKWLFPVVWVILYALMGLSAYLISMSDVETDKKKCALTVYWTQLAFNFVWSIAFFRLEWLWGGVVIIVSLLALIAIMTVLFSKIDKKAALMNIPYLLWVAFATYLNVATAIIN